MENSGFRDPKRNPRGSEILRGITSQPNITPGIHNYCDRWCEQCSHTNRCSVYAMEKQIGKDEIKGSPEDNLTEALSAMLNMAVEILEDCIKELGNEEQQTPEEDSTEIDKHHEAMNCQAVIISREYTSEVAEWLEKFGNNANKAATVFNPFGHHQQKQRELLKEAFEVITFYFMMIATKTFRVFHSNDQEAEQTDALGTSKVTIIIIDKSIDAWVKVMEDNREHEDEILRFLNKLSTIKRLILERHPRAMEFVRPGLDD